LQIAEHSDLNLKLWLLEDNFQEVREWLWLSRQFSRNTVAKQPPTGGGDQRGGWAVLKLGSKFPAHQRRLDTLPAHAEPPTSAIATSSTTILTQI